MKYRCPKCHVEFEINDVTVVTCFSQFTDGKIDNLMQDFYPPHLSINLQCPNCEKYLSDGIDIENLEEVIGYVEDDISVLREKLEKEMVDEEGNIRCHECGEVLKLDEISLIFLRGSVIETIGISKDFKGRKGGYICVSSLMCPKCWSRIPIDDLGIELRLRLKKNAIRIIEEELSRYICE